MSDKEEPKTEKIECEETGEVTDTEQYLLPMDINITVKEKNEARDKLRVRTTRND